jgi:hypothetical protein
LDFGFLISKMRIARPQWLLPVILATQEEVIRRITVPSQPRQGRMMEK